MTRIIGSAAALAALVVCLGLARPAAAEASVPCSAAGDLSGLAAKACDFLRNPGKLLSVGKNLLTGHLGSVVKSIFGGAGGTGSASTASTTLGLAAIVAWVIAGARFSLGETSDILGRTTSPRLTGSWFSSSYWRIAGIAALLTLPFLFAAAVQALIRPTWRC